MQQVLRVGDEVRLTQEVLSMSISARLYNSKGDLFTIRGFEYDEVCFDRIGMQLPFQSIAVITNGVELPEVAGPWFTYRTRDSYRVRIHHIELAGQYSDGLENWV